VASLSQGRTAAAQCGLFTYKSVPVIFEPPCIYMYVCVCVRAVRAQQICKLLCLLDSFLYNYTARNHNQLSMKYEISQTEYASFRWTVNLDTRMCFCNTVPMSAGWSTKTVLVNTPIDYLTEEDAPKDNGS